MSKIEVDAIDKQSGSTLTLGGSGTAVTLACGATQSGFGRSGSVNWQTTPKTATFTAVNGEGYFVDTATSGAVTVNLPAGSAGAIVAVSDYARNFASANCTLSANGSEKIGGITEDATLDVNGQAATFVYTDSTKGWINVQNAEDTETGTSFISATGGNTVATVCTNFKVHTFTSPGTFCVSQIASQASLNEVSYIVVAGGGGGGGSPGGNTGAGGGGGGFREFKSPLTPYTASPIEGSTPITVTATAFPIVVGGGGPGGPGPATGKGTQGSSSSFSTITSAGGGGGGAGSPAPPGNGNGTNGGSGGGGGGGSTLPGNAGGTGNTPPVNPAQGQDGGGARPNTGPSYDSAAGGGGGAGGAGSPSPNGSTGGAGGAHVNSSITGSDVEYSGGAGGGTNRPCGAAGTPGGGGAGNSASVPTNPGTNGTDNTGGGAGGSRDGGNGATGGSGIVVIRYKFQ